MKGLDYFFQEYMKGLDYFFRFGRREKRDWEHEQR